MNTQSIARSAMLAKHARILAENPNITQASELAPLMGEHEREYWQWCIERYMRGSKYTQKG